MRINIAFVMFLVVSMFLSCISTPTTNNETETMIYFYRNPSTEFVELQSFSLSPKNNGFIYSVDRNNALMVMQIGTYTITDGVITMNGRNNFQMIGKYSAEMILIEDREFLRYIR